MPGLVIRGGTVVDGEGARPRTADVAIDGDRIVEVGRVTTRGRQEINADGLLVTPGFVDLHTHFDGQASWDPILAPSSVHGVTTVAMGNCGVGFAPATVDSHEWLINMLEGVEDIPGTALAEGLTWGWVSFPEYLDALDAFRRAIDVAAHIPHAPLRAYVMGERGGNPAEHPTGNEVDKMAALVSEALEAGAIGFATSRTEIHRTRDGDHLGTLRVEAAELTGIAQALRNHGAGVIQLISDAVQTADSDFAESEMKLIELLARTSKRPVSFTVQQAAVAPDLWREVLSRIQRWQDGGLNVKGQVAPRTIGVMLGLEARLNPFVFCPAFKEVSHLSLADRVRALADSERRQRILAEHAALTANHPGLPNQITSGFDVMFQLNDPVDYQLRGESIARRARALGVEPGALAYDIMLEDHGHQLIYLPALNFSYGTLDDVREMLGSPYTLYGLSDAGAHCGAICDASTTTSYLTVWGRDCRPEQRMPIETIVQNMTSRTARHVGWHDRGALRPGLLADLNIIDLEHLGCRPPRIVHDLPAAGRRLVQEATGYRWTLKSGVATFIDGKSTGELPGRLVRGQRHFLHRQ